MKKKVTQKLCVSLTFILFGLMALGSGSSSSNDSTKEITAETGDADTDSGNAAQPESVATDDTQDDAANDEITIEEQVLFEQDGIKVTATGWETDPIWGDGVKLLIENDSNLNVGVGCNALIVNDYMISDLFSSPVAAGKKANETLELSSSQLKAAGIETIGQIEIYFHVYNSDSYETLFNPEKAVIKTSLYDSMDTSADVSGEELYNQDGIKIVGQYVDENSFWGTAVLLYIENNSGRNVGISCDNMSINDFMVSPLFSSTVYDGKKAVDDITIFSSDLENNGIESVDTIEVNFHIYDADSYNTICDTGAISFQVK